MRFVAAVLGMLMTAGPGVASDHGALSVGTEAVGQERTTLLLDTIVVWLSANFGLPAVFDHPRVNRTSASTLTEMRYGKNASTGGRSVVAIYDDDSRIVHLSRSWSSRSPAELSVLVHEMVHHLQTFDDRPYACAGEREMLAYEAQEQWLSLFGRSLRSDFGIDPLTLKVAAACTH